MTAAQFIVSYPDLAAGAIFEDPPWVPSELAHVVVTGLNGWKKQLAVDQKRPIHAFIEDGYRENPSRNSVDSQCISVSLNSAKTAPSLTPSPYFPIRAVARKIRTPAPCQSCSAHGAFQLPSPLALSMSKYRNGQCHLASWVNWLS